jgi:acetyltransferase-like isoleucine patch superfamily enzyme
MRMVIEVIKGWLYWWAFLTGGNFVRKARIKRGQSVKISPTAFFKFPENIEIGDNSFINHQCSVWASPGGKVTIGKNVLFGPGCSVIASNHGIAAHKLIREQPDEDAPITIGDDVWIGAHVVVTAGVTIGNGCVVGAGAVVVHDLPPNMICVGVPARAIRPRI